MISHLSPKGFIPLVQAFSPMLPALAGLGNLFNSHSLRSSPQPQPFRKLMEGEQKYDRQVY